jgi:amino acid adenylation domain-containing protein
MKRSEQEAGAEEGSYPFGSDLEGLSRGRQFGVIGAIFDIMSRTPRAIAVTDGDLELTYQALRRRSGIVAARLASHGIAPGSVVGMHLPRCADAIAVMLGVMASGCVYLPLDPSYPKARLQFMLDRTEAAAVISGDYIPDLYGADRIWIPAPGMLAAEDESVPSGTSVFSPDEEVFGPEDCAYILFTSGSTGKPKGVMVTHGNITLMTEWSAKVFGATQFDSGTTTCSLSFDPSFQEILTPLSVGGSVHVIPHALALGELTRPVSFVATTPTVASELLRAGQLPHIKVLQLGGEALPADVAEQLLSSGRVGRLLNAYGPTECTVAVTVEELTAPVPEVVSIGQQVPGTEVLILDEDGRQLPDNEQGEICIFGGQVAKGYVNDPAGTAARFIVDPNPTTEYRYYYRTGDLGYRSGDGRIFFQGRADSQVKVNGVRIELGEIDAALRSHTQVSEAATIVGDHGRTVAYVVPVPGRSEVDLDHLKMHLAEHLPRIMLPAGIMVLAELPMTVNGKLDTSALPEWSPGRAERETVAVDESDDIMTLAIEIISGVTDFTGQIRPSDDFISDLGGTSLGIVQVMVEFERHSSRHMRISDALADTSVAGLADLLREHSESSAADFALNTNGEAAPLFLIHAYLGGMLSFRRLAELLPSDQPVYGLQVDSGSGQPGDELSISSLARNALNRIREVQPTGQITMLGHSVGGLIAFEAARHSLAAGDPAPRVLLMDTPRPYGGMNYDWGESVLYWRQIIGNPARTLRGIARRIIRAVRPEESHLEAGSEADDLMTLTERNMKSVDIAIRRYRARAYDGGITIMRTRQGQIMALGKRYLGWSSVTKEKPRIIRAPGAHLTMLDDRYIDSVAEQLVSWLSSE